MTEMVVSTDQLYKAYGSRNVIQGLTFDVQGGICFGILGPNGAGKTTLIRMLTGFTPVSEGSFQLFGQPAGSPSLSARIGLVPQQDNLDPDFSVASNLSVYASYFGLNLKPGSMEVQQLLTFAELQTRANDKVSELSGGMRRRLMIARALVNDPDLIVLDEPTTGLDPQARHLIWQRLRSLKARGKTLILSTHYMDEAAQLCDELMLMDHGTLLARGEPARLVCEHIEPEVITIHTPVGEQATHRLFNGLNIRREQVGDTLFCYTHDAHTLISRLSSEGEMKYAHRPASLEDLFLKLTGRDLREEQ